MTARHAITWLASYPKSGNTWLRCLLEAYRRNGLLDINDIRASQADSGANLMRGVSPMPLADLGFRGEALLRPAALLQQYSRLPPPVYLKTHFANVQLEGLPPFIPLEFSERAIYVVRDPRDVVSSFAKFYQFPIDKACDAMSSNEFVIGGDKTFARSFLGTWSSNAASWASETRYPVHVVRYEDMTADAGTELTEVLQFLEIEVDEALVSKAVEATKMAKLQKAESQNGFRERTGKGGSFFNGGGSRWRDELGAKWVRRIENDHGEVMATFGYT